MSDELEWTPLGFTDSDGVTFTWEPRIRVDVELDPDDVFAAICGTSTLTGGVIDGDFVRFDQPDGGRVLIRRSALDLPPADGRWP